MTTTYSTSELLNLTEAQARQIAQNPELATWVIMQLTALARNDDGTDGPKPGAVDPSTPSAMIPPYLKEKSKKRRKKPGRKAGHEGACRPTPTRIDEREEHAYEKCPDCGERLKPSSRKTRTRVIEDIVEAAPVATEHTIHSHWCPKCKKRVEPAVTQALPRSAIGNQTLALTAWLHYGLGQSVSQIVSVLNHVFQFPVSAGGLTQMWGRAADELAPWYEEIRQMVLHSPVLNADETGWRVNGKTHWLWAFTSQAGGFTYYHIDESRGSAVVREVLGEVFEGVLVCDFYAAYNAISVDRRQRCLVHFLREIKRVSIFNETDQWVVFAPIFKKLIKDALRLGRRTDRDASDFLIKRECLYKRLDKLCEGLYIDRHTNRIIKRLKRHREEMFSFLHDPKIPSDNNHAEREVRPAVIMRKNSLHNMSNNGAQTQSILMSIYRTLKLRGLNPITTIAKALAQRINGGKLPPLPKPIQTDEIPSPLT